MESARRFRTLSPYSSPIVRRVINVAESAGGRLIDGSQKPVGREGWDGKERTRKMVARVAREGSNDGGSNGTQKADGGGGGLGEVVRNHRVTSARDS